MTFVITQGCCSDATCIDVCPVDCIHPRPDESGFRNAEMLYIDPQACIDCGACADACPVGAVFHEDDLPLRLEPYLAINEEFYRNRPDEPVGAPAAPPSRVEIVRDDGPLRVAVVGSGPAGMFVAAELFSRMPDGAVEVEVFDRLPTPWGLVRAGVAPDHHQTREITEVFRRISARRGFRFHLNVEIGEHVEHREILDHHHAVVYAVGALEGSVPDLPGADLPGSVAAARVVTWYNGHPDAAQSSFPLDGERAVVVGNGNVALDVARILVSDPDELARTDIADHALAALRTSAIREVVVLGRRGIAQAAHTSPELLALGGVAGVDVVIDSAELGSGPGEESTLDFGAALKMRIARDFAGRTGDPAHRRIVLRYLSSPLRVLGDDAVEGIEIGRNEMVPGSDGELDIAATGQVETLESGLVVWATGFRSAPVPGVPFDTTLGRIPNLDGRAVDPDTGDMLTGVYCAGWARRGPSGVIGTNRSCAKDTVSALIEDFTAGRLVTPAPDHDRAALDELLAERRPAAVDREGWLAIDARERELGRESARPRVKLIDPEEMITVAHAASSSSSSGSVR